jgi:hypothetical protein
MVVKAIATESSGTYGRTVPNGPICLSPPRDRGPGGAHAAFVGGGTRLGHCRGVFSFYVRRDQARKLVFAFPCCCTASSGLTHTCSCIGVFLLCREGVGSLPPSVPTLGLSRQGEGPFCFLRSHFPPPCLPLRRRPGEGPSRGSRKALLHDISSCRLGFKANSACARTDTTYIFVQTKVGVFSPFARKSNPAGVSGKADAG